MKDVNTVARARGAVLQGEKIGKRDRRGSRAKTSVPGFSWQPKWIAWPHAVATK